MRLLLHDKMAPITTDIAFFESAVEKTAQALFDFHSQSEKESHRGTEVALQPLAGALETVLRRLLPLTTHEIRRHLVIEAQGGWSAYFNNTWPKDLGSVDGYLPPRLNCRAVTIRAEPRNLKRLPNNHTQGTFGICELGISAPEPVIGSYDNLVRLIRVLGDDNGFEFFTEGEIQPFEKPEYYQARRIQDRFTFEMLREYCEVLGLRPFDVDFYRPEKAFIIEKYGYSHPKMKTLTLEDAWKAFDPNRSTQQVIHR